jgi:pilus assembly protein CpaE
LEQIMAKAEQEDMTQGEDFGAQPHERPVPRISIHAFCEFPDTGAALQRAAADRRLSKAHVTVELGGLQGALDHYAGQATPNLLIIETRLQGRTAVEEIERLAEVVDAATKVLIVGRVNDVELYRELMRRGVSEYLVAPLNPLHLIEVISGLYLNPEAAPIGRVVSVLGCRGGVGSSTLAHNVGWCIAEKFQINTALVDLDLAFGTSGLDFNEEPGQGVAEALSAPERLDDVLLERLLVKAGDHLSLFTAPAVLDRIYESEPAAYEAVLDAVRRMTPCVIVDLPHIWTPWVRQTILTSDDIVIVATPDLASLRNGKALFDLVKQQRPNDPPPRLIVNQVGQPKRPEIPVKDFAATMGVEPTLVLPFDPQLYGSAANNAQMLMQMKPNSPTAVSIMQLAERLTGRHAEPAEQSSVLPFLSFLKGRKQA